MDDDEQRFQEYYDFMALDRALTPQEQAQLRQRSTRARISPTRMSNGYNYGSPKFSRRELMATCFDAHLYMGYGTARSLALRFPAKQVPAATLKPYAHREHVQVEASGEHTLLWLHNEPEDVEVSLIGWAAQGQLDALVGLRAQILAGDLRAPFMLWAQSSRGQDIEVAPIPHGLGELDDGLRRFMRLFGVDEDLIQAAARYSPALVPSDEQAALRAFIQAMDAQTKDEFLLRAAHQDPGVGLELLARYRAATPSTAHVTPHHITMKTLWAQAMELCQARQERQEAERALAAARARAARMNEVAQRWDEHLRLVEAAIARRTSAGYQEAAKRLVELRDAAPLRGREEAIERRLAQLADAYARRPALMEALREATLIP